MLYPLLYILVYDTIVIDYKKVIFYMQQDQLYQRLTYLEKQRAVIEEEITIIKGEIEKQSPFSKAGKIALFHKLFIGNELVYAKHWVSKDGLKKGYAPATKTFRGTDYIPINLFGNNSPTFRSIHYRP